MVTREGRVVLLDFGIIARFGARHRVGAAADIVGTPPYMAPEQFTAADRSSPASDWYSLGALLYRALTGCLPFQGDSRSIAEAKLRCLPVPVHRLSDDAPADLADLCMGLLRPAPESRPKAAEILVRLGGDTRPAVVGQTRRDVFVGRARAVEVLRGALEDAAEGRGVSVMVQGVSGMGKSVLVERFLSSVADRADLLVLGGRCYERESVPYKALDGVVDAATEFLLGVEPQTRERLLPDDVPALLRAFPVVGQLAEAAGGIEVGGRDGGDWQRRALAGVKQLLSRLAHYVRLVIYVDDLQWGDTDSVPLLAELIGRPSIPVLFIATFRSEELDSSPVLRVLQRSLGGRTGFRRCARLIEVDALSDEEQRELAAVLLREQGMSASLCDEIAAEANGNPYFVQEMVRYAASRGQKIDRHEMSLDAVIEARIAQLSPGAKRLLRVVALAGGRLPQTIVQAAADLRKDGRRALLELATGQFVRTAGGRGSDVVEPYHDRVREVAHRGIGPDEQRAIHLRLARALDASPQVMLTHLYPLAQHYYAARSLEHAERTFEVNREAARRAAGSYAHEQAHRFYKQASHAAAQAGRTLDARFLAPWGDAAARASRMGVAGELFERALQTASDPVQRAEIFAAIARIHMGQLDSTRARAAVAAGLDELGCAVPGSGLLGLLRMLPGFKRRLNRLAAGGFAPQVEGEEARRQRVELELFTQHGYTCYFLMDHVGFARSVVRSFGCAVKLGPSSDLARWLAFAGVVAATRGRAGWVAAARRYALRYAEAAGDPATLARVRILFALADHFFGRTQRAEQATVRCLSVDGPLLENQDYLTSTADLTWNLLMRGYAREAWRWTERGLQRVALTGGRAAEGHTFRCYAGPELAMLGQSEAGRVHLDAFGRLLDELGFDPWRTPQHLAHILLWHLHAGDLGAAFEETAEAWQRVGVSPKTVPQQMRHAYIAIAYARLAQVTRTEGRARRRAVRRARRALVDLRTTAGHPTLTAHLRVAEATFARLQGRRAAAMAALDDASAIAKNSDNPWVQYLVANERAEAAGSTREANERRAEAEALRQKHGWCFGDAQTGLAAPRRADR
jgi:hypothetical protein